MSQDRSQRFTVCKTRVDKAGEKETAKKGASQKFSKNCN
jgi:hypothetical protein